MNRTITTALAIGCAAAATVATAIVAMTPGHAYAESSAEYRTEFVSTRSRADVQAELAQASIARLGDEWSMQVNPSLPLKSSYTREQAKSGYKASRTEVDALTGEDSGSAYLARTAASLRTNAMGAAAR